VIPKKGKIIKTCDLEMRMDLMERNRITNVLPFVKGKLLDVGCGYNNLVKKYRKLCGEGVGTDIFPWKGVDLVENAAILPFPDKSFDTITIIGALNHMVNRKEVLKELKRILKDDGRLIVTMISPRIGKIAHKFFKRDEKTRGFRQGETQGLTCNEVESLLWNVGFYVVCHKLFQICFNNLFIAKKKSY